MKVTVYTHKVIKGPFKGKIVKSFDSGAYVYGITPPVCVCFDKDAEYTIWWDHLKTIDEDEIEVPDYE